MSATAMPIGLFRNVNPALPPGPRAPRLVQGLQYVFRPIEFLETCARRYGDCFTWRMPIGPPTVLFSAPDAVREIFTADEEHLTAGEAALALRPILGAHSLLFLNGSRHMRERRLMLPPFHGERMLGYGQTIATIAAGVIARWPSGRPFALHPEMQRITFEVILRTVFGVEEGTEFARVRSCLSRMLARGTSPVMLWPPMQADLGRLSPWGRFKRLKHELEQLLFAEFARRRAASTQGDDILSLLLAARDEDGAPMGDDELRDEMITLLVVGHETTATALAWAFHCLLTQPDVLAKVGAELAAVIGDAPLAPQHLSRLEYLDATIKETLRLRPIVSEVGRLLVRPTRIGGRDLPAGVVAAPAIYLTHHRADVWPEPERFRPERFIGTRPSPYDFFPFGGGTRRCVGMAFALFEMRVVIAMVLARVVLRPAPGRDVRPVRRNITLAPARGLPVVVEEVHRR